MAVHPEILICDEATSALDVSVQAKIIALLLHLQQGHGMSLLFISHDLPLVSSIAERVLIMRDGRIIEQGETERVLAHPNDSYTRNLLRSAL
jgi:ABC superfamily ATP binding cassette transporter, ABC protein